MVTAIGSGHGGGGRVGAFDSQTADGSAGTMSFHPNDVIRRGRAATVIICGTLVFLLSAFFRAQVIRNEEALKVAEGNRLRSVPLPAARGVIFDRKGQPIAENVIGYSVALFPQSEDTLRATLDRLSQTVEVKRQELQRAISPA